MIVWISKNASKRPNDQRAKIVTAEPDKIIVEYCGDGMVQALKPEAIVGVELSPMIDLRFRITGMNTTTMKGLKPYPTE